MMYWALMVTSSGSSGDVKGLTPVEKIFQALCLLLFRIYFSFVEAEAARTVTSIYMSFSESLEKVTKFKTR